MDALQDAAEIGQLGRKHVHESLLVSNEGATPRPQRAIEGSTSPGAREGERCALRPSPTLSTDALGADAFTVEASAVRATRTRGRSRLRAGYYCCKHARALPPPTHRLAPTSSPFSLERGTHGNIASL